MVRSVASGGKFYRLPPDKENTERILQTVSRCFFELINKKIHRSAQNPALRPLSCCFV